MPTNSYRDLLVWKKSVELVAHVYRVSRDFPVDERFGIVAQLRRAAISVPANVAEGQGRATRGEFRNQLSVARGSLNELRTLLEISRTLEFVRGPDLDALDERADEVARMLWGLSKKIGDS